MYKGNGGEVAPVLTADIAEVLPTHCALHVVATIGTLYMAATVAALLCVVPHPRCGLHL